MSLPSGPTSITAFLLRSDLARTLRDHPRFQALLEEHNSDPEH